MKGQIGRKHSTIFNNNKFEKFTVLLEYEKNLKKAIG